MNSSDIYLKFAETEHLVIPVSCVEIVTHNADRKIDYYFDNKPNILAHLCDKYGSDKGSLNKDIPHPYPWAPHTYTDIYFRLFNHSRQYIKKILECGIGTNNPSLASNMGVNGLPGASLRVWRDFFPNAQIYGCDIDEQILFQDNRISTFQCDQRDASSVKNMLNRIDNPSFDIIIDDGLHEFNAGISFFEATIESLRDDGLYIIEDVSNIDIIRYQNYFKNNIYSADILRLHRSPQPIENNQIIIIRKNTHDQHAQN